MTTSGVYYIWGEEEYLIEEKIRYSSSPQI